VIYYDYDMESNDAVGED